MGMARSSYLPLMDVLSVLGCQSGWKRPGKLGFRTSREWLPWGWGHCRLLDGDAGGPGRTFFQAKYDGWILAAAGTTAQKALP